MIFIGTKHSDKPAVVREYIAAHDVAKVFVVSPRKFTWPGDDECIAYEDAIEYAVFYRLIQEIDRRTLVVLNECLRTQDRNDLTYNCIRHFLNQTGHQIVFQTLPLINGTDDSFILFDFDTRSRWKRERDTMLFRNATFVVNEVHVSFDPEVHHASTALRGRYDATKEKLFAELGKKDPHTIPRNLVLMSGAEKAARAHDEHWHIVRNQRLRMPRAQTYRDDSFDNTPYTILEPCHRFIDMSDLISLSGQSSFRYIMTDLKVEHWYLCQYTKWIARINAVYSAIQQSQRS